MKAVMIFLPVALLETERSENVNKLTDNEGRYGLLASCIDYSGQFTGLGGRNGLCQEHLLKCFGIFKYHSFCLGMKI